MIDENKDDEYQFTELDGSQSFDEDTVNDEVQTSFPAEGNLKRIVVSGFVVILVGFILFKFVSPYLSSEKKLTDVSVLKTKKPVSQPIKKVEVKPEPIVYKPPVQAPIERVRVINKTVTDPKVNTKLTALQHSSRLSSRKISKINNNLGALRDGVDSLTSKINSLNVVIMQLANTVKEQQSMIEALKPKLPPKKVEKKPLKPLITYHIKALIPGRGWLMSSKGITITVIKGTRIPGFGRVVSIDARHGKVVTSSGKVIQFSISDT